MQSQQSMKVFPGLVTGLRPVTPEVRLRLILCTGRSPGKMRYGAEPRNTGGEAPPHTVYGAEPRKNALRGRAP